MIELVGTAEDPEVRKHAMRALLEIEDPRSGQASIEALADDGIELRCLAATNLGRLEYGDAANALVGVLARPTPEGDDDRDAVAALLALEQLGQSDELLGAATAFRRTSSSATEALAWLFQQLSPAMDSKDETTLLMAVLDHEVDLLRRYAIQRLGELADPRTAGALEARLANETDELRPLVEVSLAAVRGAGPDGDAGVGTRSLGERAQELMAGAKELWQDEDVRTIALSGAAGLMTLLLTSAFLFRRARRRREADNWAEKTRPSEEFERPRYEDFEPEAGLGDETDVEDVEWHGEEAFEDQEAEWEPDDSPRV